MQFWRNFRIPTLSWSILGYAERLASTFKFLKKEDLKIINPTYRPYIFFPCYLKQTFFFALRKYSTGVGRPRFRHPMKVYNVKLMDESHPTTESRPIYVSGVLTWKGESTEVNPSDRMNVHNVKPMEESHPIQRIYLSGILTLAVCGVPRIVLK